MLPAPQSVKRHHMHHSTHHAQLDNNNSSATTSKRNSSMIFRIEHLIPSSNSGTTTSTASTSAPPAASIATEIREHKRQRLQRSGVFLSQPVPKDTHSEAIATHALIAVEPTLEQQQATRAYCTLTEERLLCMTASIMRKIKLAEDNSSYNALFELRGRGGSSTGHIHLRMTRNVKADEEIVAWFGEEATMLMNIPFLTPLNIQGNNRYTCHLCHLTFESPNPLKLHLALACGRHIMDILWIRLHYGLRATACTQQLLPLPTMLSMPPLLDAVQHSPVQTATTATVSSSSVSPIALSPATQTQMQRFSAFKLITPVTSSISPLISVAAAAHQRYTTATAAKISYTMTTATSNATGSTTSFLPAISSLPHAMSLLPTQTAGGSANPLNAAAQIEAIVSNMGASKQGHLCIYCGKVYSRKYGLKIHIRTHTGFKPLKCKFCLRPFGDPSNLNKHVRLHLQAGGPSTSAGSFTGEGAGDVAIEGFKCHMCHKTLARRRDLQRHIESKHGIS